MEAQTTQTITKPQQKKIVIGESVRIKNPGPLQENTGTIVKIGTSRITIKTKNGTKIIRAAKNLTVEK